MKRYTDDELLDMTENNLDALAEAGRIDDDDWQRWHDLRDDAKYLADQFIKHELGLYEGDMDGIKYEDLSVIWTRENGPDWAEIDETVIEAITKEVEEGCIS